MCYLLKFWAIGCLSISSKSQMVNCEVIAHYDVCIAESLNSDCIKQTIRQSARFGLGAYRTVERINQECNQ